MHTSRLLAAAVALVLPAISGCAHSPGAATRPVATTKADLAWPVVSHQNKPWVRWWWPGSAVDRENLSRELGLFSAAGLGGVEITPIYGARGAEDKYLNFLTPPFMDMLRYTGEEAKHFDLGVDMATGTGWPFGGPWITPPDADARFQVTPAGLVSRPTGFKVKRAAPGDEGLVVNPYSTTALDHYLAPFNSAFSSFPQNLIRSQFHDSFEYTANFSPDLPALFREMHGYDLNDHAAEMAGKGNLDTIARVKSDYRSTLAAAHLAYIVRWSEWSHQHGFLSREQAHGAPGNLLDLYAAADIPETETFGAADMPMPGFLYEQQWVGNDTPHPMISRFASSAAHVAGKPLASSETATWLREHFHVSLSQVKPEIDQMFLVGINHIIYHGSCYSPASAAWPGWLFYASTDFSPSDPIWHDFPALNAYVARCQSILQSGHPDNDVLVYWPIYDLWHDPAGADKRFAMHDPAWIESAPAGRVAEDLASRGYAFDFISDLQLRLTGATGGHLHTPGAQYSAVLVPPCHHLPLGTARQLLALAEQGGTVAFTGDLPSDVPGLHNETDRRDKLHALFSTLHFSEANADGIREADLGSGRVLLGSSPDSLLRAAGVRREALTDSGLRFLRRSFPGGHHYFVANLTGHAVDTTVPLAVDFASALLMDPLTGSTGTASATPTDHSIRFQLQPGQSLLVRTFDHARSTASPWFYAAPAGTPFTIPGPWHVDFVPGGGPVLPASFTTSTLDSWTTASAEAERFAGTARYRTELELPSPAASDYLLDLGDVRDSARVRINGHDVTTLFSLPFQTRVGSFLHSGRNVLEVEVTNLAANRIRDLDQRHVPWKVMRSPVFFNVHYRPFDASNWPVTPSGLLGPVRLTPLK